MRGEEASKESPHQSQQTNDSTTLVADNHLSHHRGNYEKGDGTRNHSSTQGRRHVPRSHPHEPQQQQYNSRHQSKTAHSQNESAHDVPRPHSTQVPTSRVGVFEPPLLWRNGLSVTVV